MRLFINGERAAAALHHNVHVAPAADLAGQEVPAEWVDDNNKPRQFTVTFENGEAEVEDALGRYLIAKGIAKKTRLIMPAVFRRPALVA